MEAITIGLITGICAIMAVLLGEVISNKKISKSIEAAKELFNEKHTVRKTEHDGLSKEHDGLSKELGGLSKEHLEIKEKLNFIERSFISQNALEEAKINSLTHSQMDMVSVVNSVSALGDEIKRMSLELSNVAKEKENLLVENKELKEKIRTLELKKTTDFEKNKGFER